METKDFAPGFNLDQVIEELARARATKQLVMSRRMVRLATYVQANKFDFAINGIREISGAAQVSPTTVLKFARLLGFSSLKSFKRTLRRQLQASLALRQQRQDLIYSDLRTTSF